MNMDQVLDIPYIKLHFYAAFSEDSKVPMNKVSALRGGMGEMLLRQNCISDRDCENCLFEHECIAQRTIYTKMDDKPDYMTGKDSLGYLIECEDYREALRSGDVMSFSLTLFGKNIVYFNQYLQAFHMLGMVGIGKDAAMFEIVKVENTHHDIIFKEGAVDMRQYKVENILNYVKRRQNFLKQNGFEHTLQFKTPVSIKYQGNMINRFDSEAVCRSIFRRIDMMDYFCGNEHLNIALDTIDYPQICTQTVKKASVRRYSNVQERGMRLFGIIGEVVFVEIGEEILPYLLAGEILHIGKNTSFGFGRYKVV